jgi:hypothetical protein
LNALLNETMNSLANNNDSIQLLREEISILQTNISRYAPPNEIVFCEEVEYEKNYDGIIEKYEITVCTYKNIMIIDTCNQPPYRGVFYCVRSYYKLNNDAQGVGVKVKLNELFNSKSNELLNKLCESFKKQTDSILQIIGNDNSDCAMVMKNNFYSFDDIKLGFIGFTEENQVYFSANIAVNQRCGYYQAMMRPVIMSLEEFSKYLIE